MKKYKEFILAIQEMLDSDPEMPEEKRKALEAAIASLKKDKKLEALRAIAPLLGQIGKALLQHHGHW
jgi:hypothetical protein